MFKVRKQKNKRRLGELRLPHGRLQTPFFMPDATRAVLKMGRVSDLGDLGLEAMVVNTFHLYLQPGTKIIQKSGGVNKFMNWPHPLLSDSGGFQVFSLIHRRANMGKVYDDRVVFKSPLDGSKHELTPEKSIQIQFDLGVDMMVCLDDCPPHDFDRIQIEKAVDRTIAWADRCAREYERQIKKRKLGPVKRPGIFAVIQGGSYADLRKKCYDGLVAVAPKTGWLGYGLGARPVDAQGKFLDEIIAYTADLIPPDKVRFALGVGTPEDIIRCYNLGWDIFDCVIPSREGRHGRLFFPTSRFSRFVSADWKLGQKISGADFFQAININNAGFAGDFSPINKNSRLPELKKHTRAYLHHLFKIKEPLGAQLATLNNLEFYLELMREIASF